MYQLILAWGNACLICMDEWKGCVEVEKADVWVWGSQRMQMFGHVLQTVRQFGSVVPLYLTLCLQNVQL